MRLLIRADASVNVGTGHVVRCAALAQGLVAAGHEVEFLCREVHGNLNRWLEVQGFKVFRLAERDGEATAWSRDASITPSVIGQRRYDWVVSDCYDLDRTWERSVAIGGAKVLVIDDLGRQHDCHLLMDQNYPNPAHELYPARVPSHCELLLGPRFALVRPEFAFWRPVSLGRTRSEISRILVFMGGSDPQNETTKVLNGIAVIARPGLTIDVVVGSANPHASVVQSASSRLPGAIFHMQTSRMAELMAGADVAICAGGGTTWERCMLGLPALVTILADNQRANAEGLATLGAHSLLGPHESVKAADYAEALMAFDTCTLGRMSKVAAGLCDGGGAARVIERLTRNPRPARN